MSRPKGIGTEVNKPNIKTLAELLKDLYIQGSVLKK